MRIRGRPNLLQPILVLICLVLSSFLLSSSGYLISASMPWYLAMALSFVIALLISSGIGMLFEERSRFGGILLLAVFLPNIYFLFKYPILRFDGLLLGLIMGVGLIVHSFVNNRFDSVAKITRKFVRFYIFGMAVFILYIITQLMATEDIGDLPTYLTTGSNDIFFLLVSIFTLVALSSILTKHIRGIKASDVFVYGPSRSGKTLLLIALYNQFVNCYEGKRKELIISSLDEDYYRIENLLSELHVGKPPKSNSQTDLALYILNGKMGIKPIEFTFVDYGGEYTEHLTPDEYENALSKLSSAFDGINPLLLSQKIDDPIFLNELKDKYAGKLAYTIENLVLAYIYKKFQTAGKVVFLVDGDHIINYHKDGAKELTRLFGQYSRIMELFGEGKSYAIVVTKADKIKDISEIMENSPEAADIENEIFEMLIGIDTFKEIQNRASKESIHFFIVSANAMIKKSANGEGQIKQIYPWRIEEIAKFGF